MGVEPGWSKLVDFFTVPAHSCCSVPHLVHPEPSTAGFCDSTPQPLPLIHGNSDIYALSFPIGMPLRELAASPFGWHPT